MKLVKEKKTFDNPEKKGESICYWQVYLLLDDGQKVAIKATYKQETAVLRFLAEEIKK